MSEYIVEMPKEPAKVVRDGWNVRIEWQYKQREEIVRCRDCKFCDYDVFAYWCCREKYREFEVDSLDGERMGFCAWGERKERIEK